MNIEQMVRDNLVYQVVGGSHAYGLNTPASDRDMIGAFIPPPQFVIGMDVAEHFRNKVEDENYVSIDAFMKHMRTGSSYWVEAMFVDQEQIEVETEYWKPFREVRQAFLTKALVKKSLGFMLGMYNRSQSQQKLGEKDIPGIDLMSEVEKAEKLSKLKQKQMMHAVRVGGMIIDMIESGTLRVKQENKRDMLMAIRNGGVPLEDTYKIVDAQIQWIDAHYPESWLPDEVDTQMINSLLVPSVVSYWKDKGWV